MCSGYLLRVVYVDSEFRELHIQLTDAGDRKHTLKVFLQVQVYVFDNNHCLPKGRLWSNPWIPGVLCPKMFQRWGGVGHEIHIHGGVGWVMKSISWWVGLVHEIHIMVWWGRGSWNPHLWWEGWGMKSTSWWGGGGHEIHWTSLLLAFGRRLPFARTASF